MNSKKKKKKKKKIMVTYAKEYSAYVFSRSFIASSLYI